MADRMGVDVLDDNDAETRFKAGLCSDCPHGRRDYKSRRCPDCRLAHHRAQAREAARKRRQRPEIRESERRSSERYRAKYPERVKATNKRYGRKYYLLNNYGITDEQYDALVKSQSGRCAICKRSAELHVDHCHETGRVRALLCGKCNRGIGMFDESPRVLRAAISYLKRVADDEGAGSDVAAFGSQVHEQLALAVDEVSRFVEGLGEDES